MFLPSSEISPQLGHQKTESPTNTDGPNILVEGMRKREEYHGKVKDNMEHDKVCMMIILINCTTISCYTCLGLQSIVCFSSEYILV